MNQIHLTVSNSVNEEKSRRVTTLKEDGGKTVEVFHEFDRVIPWTENTLLDGHVLVMLLYAASRNKPLRVYGAVSQTLLRNADEFLRAWNRWKPEVYNVIDIIPDRIVGRKEATTGKAISAFSGGVDATFTALKHSGNSSARPEVCYPLNSVVMVHGFDVDLHNHGDFAALLERQKVLLNELNLDIRTVRTNSRELRLQFWDDSFALELAACLHMFSDEFDYGLIGSSEPYEDLVLPWGSTPVTDHLLSGGQFSIIHDGAGYSRTDKVEVISHHQTACRTLKVCWAGADQSKNCGKCEKCVRTQLNFLISGSKTLPECFPNKELDANLIKTIEINNAGQKKEMSLILDYAKKRGVQGEWVNVLQERLDVWKPIDAKALARKNHGGPLKRSIKKIVVLMNLEEPAKKIWRGVRRQVLRKI